MSEIFVVSSHRIATSSTAQFLKDLDHFVLYFPGYDRDIDIEEAFRGQKPSYWGLAHRLIDMIMPWQVSSDVPAPVFYGILY